MCIQENELRISTSIGIAVSCGDSAESAYDLMKNADKAMYEAKNAKRNLNRRHDEVTRIQDYP
jgi:GGDEF domain-containing protein